MAIDSVRELRNVLRVLEREIGSQFAFESGCCGVSPAQRNALLEVDLIGPVSLNGLADALGLDKSTLSRTVESLVKAGLVQRVSSSTDRRSVVLTLSPKGFRTVEEINLSCDEHFSTMLEHMSPSMQKAMMRGVEVLTINMQRKRKQMNAV